MKIDWNEICNQIHEIRYVQHPVTLQWCISYKMIEDQLLYRLVAITKFKAHEKKSN